MLIEQYLMELDHGVMAMVCSKCCEEKPKILKIIF